MPRLKTIFNLSKDLISVLLFSFLVIKLTVSLLERFSPKFNNEEELNVNYRLNAKHHSEYETKCGLIDVASIDFRGKAAYILKWTS